MKLALLALIVLIGVLLWKSRPSAPPRKSETAPQDDLELQDMVRCALCSVHVPVADAIQGQHGVYCCPEHLHHAEP